MLKRKRERVGSRSYLPIEFRIKNGTSQLTKCLKIQRFRAWVCSITYAKLNNLPGNTRCNRDYVQSEIGCIIRAELRIQKSEDNTRETL
jgi:hypothetical protein